MAKKPVGGRPCVLNERAPAGFEFAKAKGGYRWHIRPTGTNTARCGYTPTNSLGRSFQRAGWWILKEPQKGLMYGARVCCACEAS